MKHPQKTQGQALSVQFCFKGVFAARSFRESNAKRIGIGSGLTHALESRWRPAGSWPQGFCQRCICWSRPLFYFVCLIFTLDSVSKCDEWAAQMSHSLSLDVMEMAEAAALLDRLAAGLEATPNTSGVPSPSERSTRPGPCDRTCCWSLEGRGGRDTGHSKKSSRQIVPLFSDPFTPSSSLPQTLTSWGR